MWNQQLAPVRPGLRLNQLTALTTEIGNEQLDQAKLDRKIWLLKLEQALERGVSNVGDAVANLKVTAKAYGVEVTVEHVVKPKQQ